MQTLKKEVQEAIINASIEEFLEKGFALASMRSIASKANISVGNVYRYFKNKESLLETIVQPAIQALEVLFNPRIGDDGRSLNLAHALKILKDQFPKILIHYRDPLIILYDCCDGTSYAAFKINWKRSITTLFTNYIEVYNHKFPESPFDLRIANSASTSFLEGIIQIIREYEHPKDIEILTLEYIRLYFNWSIRL